MRRRRAREPARARRDEVEEAEWVPKTEIGRKVKAGEITSLDQIFEQGKPILEHQITDALLPALKEDVLSIGMTQRATDCGRKSQFRAVVVVGRDGYIGFGAGKADETKPAIKTALIFAKRNMMRVPLGCGSWECGCGTRHTVPIAVSGKSGSVIVTLKPAPRGAGIVAGGVAKRVLAMVGIKDVWSFSKGRTRNAYNTAAACINALKSLNSMKMAGDWDAAHEQQAAAQESGVAEEVTEHAST